MKKKPTIKDVASVAGVSKSTVSKYLNDTPYVSLDTKKDIEKAIKELGYRPNNLARSLVHKSTGLIGLVISDYENLINKDLIKAVDEEANKQGYSVVLSSTNDDVNKERNISDILANNFYHLDGVILASPREEGVELRKLVEQFNHIVLVHRHVPNNFLDYVIVDGYMGGRLAAEYLIGLGHERIAMFAGPKSIYQFKERIRGFEDALKAHGLHDKGEIVDVEQSVDGGYKAAENIVFEPSRPSAIFASSDMIALGVLDAARHYNWDIPGDISIIGFDNIFFSRLARVPLTTVDARIKDLGTIAVQKLVERISGTREEVEQIVLRPTLVFRESCREIKKEE